MPAEVIARIDACWWRGGTIGETIKAVRRSHGVRLPFDHIHSRFVALSWETTA